MGNQGGYVVFVALTPFYLFCLVENISMGVCIPAEKKNYLVL